MKKLSRLEKGTCRSKGMTGIRCAARAFFITICAATSAAEWSLNELSG
ncbi:hypothetical protein [Acetanaerobacterium elongatum]|nr:hypothetical protein [Acetanaerobacterium elongatum]